MIQSFQIEDFVRALDENHVVLNEWEVVLVLIGQALLVWLGAWHISYAGQDAKERARKKHLADITTTVASIKADFAASLAREVEGLRHFNTLSTLAAEKRLAAHQDAYRLAAQASMQIAQDDERMVIDKELRDLFNSSCLYLSSEVRDALWGCASDLLDSHVCRMQQRDGLDREQAGHLASKMVGINRGMAKHLEKILASIPLPNIGETVRPLPPLQDPPSEEEPGDAAIGS